MLAKGRESLLERGIVEVSWFGLLGSGEEITNSWQSSSLARRARPLLGKAEPRLLAHHCSLKKGTFVTSS